MRNVCGRSRRVSIVLPDAASFIPLHPSPASPSPHGVKCIGYAFFGSLPAFSATTPTMADTPPPQLKYTLERSHNFYTSEIRGASGQNKRKSILRDLDCIIPEYDIEQFLDSLPVTNVNFDEITEQLVDMGVILEVPPDAGGSPNAKKFKLAYFPVEPKNCTETENVVFHRLNENVYQNMVAAVSQKYSTVGPTTQLRTDPNTASVDDRKNKTKPVAHFILDGRINGKKCDWEDISCTGEFSKADSIADRDDVGAL